MANKHSHNWIKVPGGIVVEEFGQRFVGSLMSCECGEMLECGFRPLTDTRPEWSFSIQDEV